METEYLPVSYTHLATTGVITSKSSGSESISYASPSEIANGAKAWSTVYSSAGDEQATNKLLYDTAKVYLMGVRDNNGVPLPVSYTHLDVYKRQHNGRVIQNH